MWVFLHFKSHKRLKVMKKYYILLEIWSFEPY